MKWSFVPIVALSLFIVPFLANADDITCPNPAVTESDKALCRQALDQVTAELAQAQKDLATTQSQSSSLANDIAVLSAKIKAAQLNIKAKNLIIQNLGIDITQKQGHINDLEARITQGKSTLATILRKTNEIDAATLPELILSQKSVTGFFNDIDTFQAVQDSLKSTFETLRSDEASTTAEKTALTNRQNAEMDARYAIQQEQKNIQADEIQKKQLLSISKDNEKAYSNLIAEKQSKAAQIRAVLFSLAGTNSIKFGDAYNYALVVSKQTGVPPAFLLAIITQESNLGKNVGQCILTDTISGNGIGVNTGTLKIRTMNPSRDITPFMQIIQANNLDINKTPVSCWIPIYDQYNNPIGWGGAMGPAQFIASTWVLPNLSGRIERALGISTLPNPWNPAHAFMASGIFLADLGGDSSSYSAQKNAACRYYSGSSCPTGQRKSDSSHRYKYSDGLYYTSHEREVLSYGTNVLNLAYFNSNSIQSQIDQL